MLNTSAAILGWCHQPFGSFCRVEEQVVLQTSKNVLSIITNTKYSLSISTAALFVFLRRLGNCYEKETVNYRPACCCVGVVSWNLVFLLYHLEKSFTTHLCFF